MKEKEYKVTWTMDISAGSHKEAAEKALRVHRNPESIATVFTVQRVSKFGRAAGFEQGIGKPRKIDLTFDD